MRYKELYLYISNMNKDLIIKEYTLNYGVKYWICENPFTEGNLKIIEEYVNNLPYNINKEIHNNPNSVNATNEELNKIPFLKDIFAFMNDFFMKHFNNKYINDIRRFNLNPDFFFWVNKYSSEITKKSNKNVFIPHLDGKIGIVVNLWLSKDISSSSTKLFKYRGRMRLNEKTDNNGIIRKNLVETTYIDHVDMMDKNKNTIYTYSNWVNLDNDELIKYGFEYLGDAPSIYSYMTIYETNIPHVPYIPPEITTRNSISIMLSF